MKTVRVKTTENGEAYLDLQDFADLLDISKVKKYKLEEFQDGETGKYSLFITFYDGRGKQIETKSGDEK